MSYPKVDIQVQNGNLGAVAAANDGICGLIVGDDVGASGITAGTLYTLNSIDDAKSEGFDDIAFTYRQITEFYAAAGYNKKLYVTVVPNTETMEDICDSASTNAYAAAMLEATNGEIRFLGVARLPGAGYTATYANEIDDDAFAAIAKAQAQAVARAGLYQPLFFIIEARDYQGTAADLTDLRTGSANRVALVICSSDAAVSGTHDKSAAVGLAMGKLAINPVQRKLSRVKDGALPITTGYLSDGTAVANNGDIATISEKGYICIRDFTGRTGFWFADDALATIATEDYNSITNRRVIDKAIRIVYNTYVNELNDEIPIDSAGKIEAARAKEFQGLIDNAVNQSMTANGECSAFNSFIDLSQNILSTNKITILAKITPVGYSREIVVELGFENPAL